MHIYWAGKEDQTFIFRLRQFSQATLTGEGRARGNTLGAGYVGESRVSEDETAGSRRRPSRDAEEAPSSGVIAWAWQGTSLPKDR